VRLQAIVLLVGVTAAPAANPDANPEKPDQFDSARYVKHTFGPKAVVMAGAGAAVNQVNNTPHEWGQGAAGFGRRFASSFGKHIVHKAIQYPIARLRHEEFGYHPSGKQEFGPRLKYALVGTVITHKTTTGQSTVAVGQIAGAVGSGLISRLWQPASVSSVASGFASGGITLGVDAGLNVVKEFWPNIRHPHRHSSTAGKSRGVRWGTDPLHFSRDGVPRKRLDL
jgi:hypothetical protein